MPSSPNRSTISDGNSKRPQKRTGRPIKEGKSKGGIKAQVRIHATELLPCLVRFTEGVRHDHTFLKYLNVPECSYIVMDKGYADYLQYGQE